MIFLPPRSGKSELCSRAFPAWCLGRNPDEEIIACSHTADLANAMSVDVRGIIGGDKYQSIFPRVALPGRGTPRRNTTDFWQLAKGSGSYRAAGVGGAITGRGFTLGIIDDPFKDAEQALSPTYREKVKDWYLSTFLTRAHPLNSRVLMTVTRWHAQDLPGRLLELAAEDPAADQWEVLSIPAMLEGQAVEGDPRRVVGESFWPDRFTPESLAARKATLGAWWDPLYQQRPKGQGGEHFRSEWFRSWRDAGDRWILQSDEGPVPVLKALCTIYAVVDPAATEHERADPTAIGAFAVSPHNEVIVLEVGAEHCGIDGFVPFLRRFTNRWNPVWVSVEANGFQTALVREARRTPGLPPIRELEPRGKTKLVRATPAICRAESGQIYVPHGEAWVKPFLKELTDFTGLDDIHDDRVDVLAYAVWEADRFGRAASAKPTTDESMPNRSPTAQQRADNRRRPLWGR